MRENRTSVEIAASVSLEDNFVTSWRRIGEHLPPRVANASAAFCVLSSSLSMTFSRQNLSAISGSFSILSGDNPDVIPIANHLMRRGFR
jgi:hypothetical protein